MQLSQYSMHIVQGDHVKTLQSGCLGPGFLTVSSPYSRQPMWGIARDSTIETIIDATAAALREGAFKEKPARWANATCPTEPGGFEIQYIFLANLSGLQEEKPFISI
jgi:hypothetical protein